MASTAFHFFPLLPTELRLQIWHEALPPPASQLLFSYQRGCWDPRYLTGTEPDYDPDNEENNLCMEFHCNRLKPLEFDIPLFYVNHESRKSALSWIHDQNLAIRFDKDSQSLVFLRSFDPKRDLLYVSEKLWHDFHVEPFDRIFEPDLQSRNITCLAPAIYRLAVSSELFLKNPKDLSELFHWYYGIEELLLIVEARPDEFWHGGDDFKARQRWEPESGGIQWPTFRWTEASDDFRWEGNIDLFSNEPLYKLLQDLGPQLVDSLKAKTMQALAIRPITIAKK